MPRGLENSIIDFCRSLYGSVGWLGVLIAMTIESAAIPLPSEVIMPLAGWLLIQDKGHSLWYVVIAGLVGAAGCVLGSAITYWIGAAGGRSLLMKYGRFVLISPHHIEVADKWFEEKGEATAFFSRLLPIVRTFISLPAGVARMHFPRFIIYTFVGSFIWCVALATGGYYAGANWVRFRDVLRPFDYPVAAAVVILLVLFIVRGRQARDRVPAEARD
ncbi:MAG: DedA family protein [Thermomicrobiales bacterium]